MASTLTVERAGTRLAGGIGNPLKLWLSPKPWAAAAFFILSFALGIFWFIALATLISTGIGLAITLIGLPLLVATAIVWTWGAQAERLRIELFTGARIPSPYRRNPPGPALRRLKAFGSDPAVWRDLGYLLLLFPLGIVEFIVLVLCVTLPLWLLNQPLHSWQDDTPPLALALLLSALGLAMIVFVPYVLAGVMRGHVVLARALLGPPREELAARVDELTESRSRVMDAALAERRRIEREPARRRAAAARGAGDGPGHGQDQVRRRPGGRAQAGG